MLDKNPYATTTNAVIPRYCSDIRCLRIRWAAGVLIPLSLLTGALGTVFGLMRSFGRLAETTSVNPSQLASDISNSLMVGVIAILIAGIAFCVWLWVSFVIRRKKALEPMTFQDSNSPER